MDLTDRLAGLAAALADMTASVNNRVASRLLGSPVRLASLAS
jgi:hypothetical protein